MALLVERYSSSGEDSYSEDQLKRKRRKSKNWARVQHFESKELAEKHLKDEGGWSRSHTKNPAEGMKVYYRCNLSKWRSERACKASVYLLFHADNTKVSLFRSTDEHHHEETEPHGLSKAVRFAVKQLFDEGITKPKQIMEELRQRDMEEPSKRKLYNFLQTYRRERYGSRSISTAVIRQFCLENSELPETQEAAYVVAHEISSDKDNQVLRLFFSSRRLMSLTGLGKAIHADTTHKLSWQGYPLHVIGTTDMDHKFHPSGIAIMTSDQKEDFEFLFSSLRRGLSSTCGKDPFQQGVLLADASDAVTDGFRLVYGEPRRIICWHQVITSSEKHESFRSLGKETQAKVKADIGNLQLSLSASMFYSAALLFIEKWRLEADDSMIRFLTYFEEQWLRKYPNWYEGATLGMPNTNNALEATCAAFKRDGTFRERLPVEQFLRVCSEMVQRWSVERDDNADNCTLYATKPTKPLSLWTAAYQWVKSKPTIRQDLPTEDGGLNFYVRCSESDAAEMTAEAVEEYKHAMLAQVWPTYGAFVASRLAMWHISLKMDDWENAMCTCPQWQEAFVCKHTLGIAICSRCPGCNVPNEAKTVSLDGKRKRGRPALDRTALLV